MTIDLSELEVGDTVKYGKSSKCLVCYVKKINAFRFVVILFNMVNHSQTSYQYDNGGKNLHGGVDIVEIIKAPKWAADKDMKAAYCGLGETSMNFDAWLAKHKENRYD